VEIDEFELAAPSPDDELLAVHEVLDAFSVQYPVQAQLVKLRYFAGMTNEEASQVLGISLSTLNNYWNFSRAWLFKQILAAQISSEVLDFSPGYPVYLAPAASHPTNMESRQRQMRQTGRLSLAKPAAASIGTLATESSRQ
jgi:hypothetical protein